MLGLGEDLLRLGLGLGLGLRLGLRLGLGCILRVGRAGGYGEGKLYLLHRISGSSLLLAIATATFEQPAIEYRPPQHSRKQSSAIDTEGHRGLENSRHKRECPMRHCGGLLVT